MKNFAATTFENALNYYLHLDPSSSTKLQALDGKILKLCIKPITVFFCFEQDKIVINQKITEDRVTATLEGYPLAFIQLHFASKENAPKLFKQELSIQGDLQFGQEVRDLFQTLDIDWEEYLSQFTGDIIAYEVNQLFQRSSLFASKLNVSIQQNITEFLQEEAKHLPCKEEIEDFCDDIDHLTLRVDRLEPTLNEKL